MIQVDISKTQYDQLLQGLNEVRVSQRKGGGGKMLSYLEAYDVKAHLTRVFGFGGWSWQIEHVTLAFEEQQENRWVIGYRVQGTLTVQDCKYSGVAVGSAMGSQADAHDNAVKNGDSDALKRAAINLGDQFGLSLYANGSTRPVVQKTLDHDDS